MKRTLRFAALLLSLSLLVGALPFAAADSVYSGLSELSRSAAVEATFEQTTGGKQPATYATDGDLATRWSTYGATQRMPQALQIDLGQSAAVSVVDSWWYGDGRRYVYDVYVTDQPLVKAGAFSAGQATPAATGCTAEGKGAASGVYGGLVTLSLPAPANGRYVTLLVTAETAASGPASLWEVRVWGTKTAFANLADGATATATFEQTNGATCPASQAIDGSLATRWSTFGATERMPQAIQIDMGKTAVVRQLNVWWFQTGRSYVYDLFVTSEPVLQNGVIAADATPRLANQTATGSGDGTNPPDRTGVAAVTLSQPAAGRYVTLRVTDAASGGPAAIWEIEILGDVDKPADAPIAALRAEPTIAVDLGTAQDDLPLPATVSATLTDGQHRQVPVTWACADYKPQTAGRYTFVGTPVVTGELTNPENLTVSKTVEVNQLSVEGRAKLSLNDGWVFYKGKAAEAGSVGFDDAAFDPVTLPHTWNADDGADGGNNYYQGDGWYRLHLPYREAFTGRRVYLYFEGVSRECTVYVNGLRAGGHRGAYTAFYVDITDYLTRGDNLIAVCANNEIAQDLAPLSGDFTQYGGIYRDLSLVVTAEAHIDTADYGSDGLYQTTTNVSAASADVAVKAAVVNDSAAPQTVTVRYDLSIPAPEQVEWINEIPTEWLPFDPADMTVAGGRSVHSVEKTLTVQPGQSQTFTDSFTLSNPHLWNGLADPFRYIGTVTLLQNGKATDRVQEFVGFRNFEVDYETGASLNGEPYNLRGAARHQDRKGMGNALTLAEHREDFAMLYEMGCNAVRLAHYPQADAFYNLCDQYGMAVWAEIPFVNDIGGSGSYNNPDATRAAFFETTRVQMKELIRQQYNHPAIVVWGIHNEVFPAHEDVMMHFAQELIDLCKAEDPTRLVTEATANASTPNWPAELIATNLYPGWYYDKYTDLTSWVTNFRNQTKGKPTGISEYGIGANYEHHCEGSPAVVCASDQFYEYEEYQAEGHESFLKQIKDMDFLWCTFIWNMFDFGADARYEAQVGGINNKGMVSFDRTVKKDAFYMYKANWSPLPTTHLCSSRFVYRESDSVVVKGYSNCDKLSLYVNDKLVGTKTQAELEQETVFLWRDVALQPGANTVRLEGEKDGDVYTDEAVWQYVKVTSDFFTLRESNKTLVLPPVPVAVSRVQTALQVNVPATITVYDEAGETPVTEGNLAAGMQVKVEAGGAEFWYTFVRGNLALDATATATYEQTAGGLCPAGNAIDGSVNTRWSTYGENVLPQAIQIDLGQSRSLASIEALWYGDGRRYVYDVYVTDQPMLPLASHTGVKPLLADRSAIGYGSANGLPEEYAFTVDELPAGTAGRYVTVVITGGEGISNIAAIWELEILPHDVTLEDLAPLEEKILAIGELTPDNYKEKAAAIEAAEAEAAAIAEAFGERAPRYAEHYELLTAARARYDKLAGGMADLILKAEAAIKEMGTVTAANVRDRRAAIEAAEAAVKALTDAYGEEAAAEVGTLAALEAARALLNAAGTGLMGDVNEDGKVNAADALQVLSFAVGKRTLTDAQKAVADVNKDGKINAGDALEILKKSVGKPASF